MSNVSDGQIGDDLYDLTELMARHGHDAAHGFLGGEWGYGAEHDCPVFEMHPFWWGDCECGHEEQEAQWEDANPHAETCYQAELARRGWPDSSDLDLCARLAREWGLSEWGAAVHCTCGQRERWAAWLRDHDHDSACPIVRPNFRHKGTGVEVRFYKYLGRDMQITERPSLTSWAAIVEECRLAVVTA